MALTGNPITYRRTKVRYGVDKMRTRIHQHIEGHTGLRPDLDVEALEKMELLQKLHGFGAFAAGLDNKMIGYALFILANSLISKHLLEATEVGFFIDPDYRDRGVAHHMMGYVHGQLKMLGAGHVLHACPPGEADGWGEFIKRTGGKEIERRYLLPLGD